MRARAFLLPRYSTDVHDCDGGSDQYELERYLVSPGHGPADMIWPDKAACDVVREAHLLKHPAPDHAGLICLRVPDHIAARYLPKKPSTTEI